MPVMTGADDHGTDASGAAPQLVGSLDRAAFPNWLGLEQVPVEALLDIALEDGIPVAWVPPAEVLIELLNASGHDARLEVLSRFESVIVAACGTELAGCVDEWMAEDIALAERVIAAFQEGHREAAACLALLGAEETFYEVTQVPRETAEFDARLQRYWREERREEIQEREPGIGSNKLNKEVERWLRAQVSYAGLTQKARYRRPAPGWGDGLNPQAVFLPLRSLYVPYWPGQGDPVPPNLSRHLVAHRPRLEHLSRGHCLVAVMLMTSFFVQKQAYFDDIRMQDLEVDSESA